MLIPLRTDRPPRRPPVMTISLVAINVAVHLYGQLGNAQGWFDVDDFVDRGQFDPMAMRWWQIITSMLNRC